MAELAIIADDLTGALDAAAPFAIRGLSTVVALSIAAIPRALAAGTRIIGISTGSREMNAEAATEAVRAALRALPAGTAVFKKVDSRLKGNIAAELDAIPHQQSLVVPAIPEFGRVTRAGQIHGFGVAEPIDIGMRLGRHAARARIPDIASQDDIETALEHGADLVIGARGLAEAMARRMAPAASPSQPRLPRSSAYCIIGSTDPITLAQLEHLRRTCPDRTDISAPNGVAPDVGATTGLVVLQATPGTEPADGLAVAKALGHALRQLSPPSDALLLVSGGATAQVILETLGIEILDLLGEALPGMPVSRAGDLTVVTKSGGFGEPDSLSRLLASYSNARSPVPSHVG